MLNGSKRVLIDTASFFNVDAKKIQFVFFSKEIVYFFNTLIDSTRHSL